LIGSKEKKNKRDTSRTNRINNFNAVSEQRKRLLEKAMSLFIQPALAKYH
jgi:hypothetical protein